MTPASALVDQSCTGYLGHLFWKRSFENTHLSSLTRANDQNGSWDWHSRE